MMIMMMMVMVMVMVMVYIFNGSYIYYVKSIALISGISYVPSNCKLQQIYWIFVKIFFGNLLEIWFDF